ncbi:jg13506, partial [Pararge aegeria aegeria]
MTTKSAYDKVALRQILSDDNCRAIDNEGRVFPPSHEVYLRISNTMHNKGSVITPKHVHTIINNNRSGFRDLIMEVFNIRSRELSINDSNNSVEIYADHKSDALISFTSIRVNLVISQEKWQNIKPQEKIYGKRIYWKLRQGWADVVAETLWVQHHVDCVFVFKNNNIYLGANAKFFLTIEGFCRECSAKIYCTLLKEPSKGVDVILQCNVDGIKATSHSGNKRRQLRGTRRIEVANYLIDSRKDAVVWRRQEAHRLKQFGENNPPILPSNEVVRKAKEQRLLSKYGLQFANPALNLLKSAEH